MAGHKESCQTEEDEKEKLKAQSNEWEITRAI